MKPDVTVLASGLKLLSFQGVTVFQWNRFAGDESGGTWKRLAHDTDRSRSTPDGCDPSWKFAASERLAARDWFR